MIFRILFILATGLWAQNFKLEYSPSTQKILHQKDTLSWKIWSADTLIDPAQIKIEVRPPEALISSLSKAKVNPSYAGPVHLKIQNDDFSQGLDYLIQPLMTNTIEPQIFRNGPLEIEIPSLAILKEGNLSLTPLKGEKAPQGDWAAGPYQVQFLTNILESPLLSIENSNRDSLTSYEKINGEWVPISSEFIEKKDGRLHLAIPNWRGGTIGFTSPDQKATKPQISLSPNPFSPRIVPRSLGYDQAGAEIRIDYPNPPIQSRVELLVFEKSGWKVATLLQNELVEEWPLKVLWKGMDYKGKTLRNGSYRIVAIITNGEGKKVLRLNGVIFQ